MEKYNTIDVNGKVLKDVNKNGKVIDWREKKLNTLNLSDSYKRLGKEYFNKSTRVSNCGTFLEYKRFKDDYSLQLNHANFCKVRLCPMCSWRRSLKIYGQVSKIMNEISSNNEYDFLFLTLTVSNCTSDELSESINKLLKSFQKMSQLKRYKKSIIGHFRALEVTHNLINDTYHPHLHCVLVVNKSYCKKKDIYISQEEWTQLWKKSLQIDYIPIVHITKFKDRAGKSIEKSVAEASKYTVKSDDYIIKDDITGDINQEFTDKAVKILDRALANRRLIAFGGLLKDIFQQLNLDDPENGDLVNTDNEEIRADLNYIIERYSWNIGYKQYIKIERS